MIYYSCSMYIIESKSENVNTGCVYSYCKLFENVMTPKGPRKRMVLYLGKLNLSKEKLQILGTLIERRLAGKHETVSYPDLEPIVVSVVQKYNNKINQELDKKKEAEEAVYVEVDLNSTNQTDYRTIGCETLCEFFWKKLDYDNILKKCGLNRKEIDLAKVIIFGRLISPGSERHTISWFYNQSSLLETLSTDLSNTGKDAFYDIADILYAKKEKIEELIRVNTKKQFPYFDKIYLYDLTNTYFEGRKLNSSLCKRGKSKEKRTDCPLVTLALVVDQHGFPIHSKIYRGNQSEPLTLKEILEKVYEPTDNIIDKIEKPSIAMDRGIATKDNLAYLKENNYSYFIIERREVSKLYQEEFSDIIETGLAYQTKSKQTVYMKRVDLENCSRILVHSPMKKNKEDSMTGRKENHYLEDIGKLIASNKNGKIKDAKKIHQRIGRLKEKYGAISSIYNIKLIKDKDKKKKDYVSEIRLEKKNKPILIKRKELPGCYVIETDQKAHSTEEIWEFYMTLNKVESAFRSIKSDLGTRPIYHQLDSRIESHLFISIMSYNILKSIVYSLSERGDYHADWDTIRTKLTSHMRGTTIQKSRDGKMYHTRVTGIPEKEAQEIYDILGVKIKKKRIIKETSFHL